MVVSPFNVQFQQQYLNCCRRYKKLLRRKKQTYRDNLVDKLVKMAEQSPSDFWKTLESLKNIDDNGTNNNNSNIPSDEWYEHFKSVGSREIQLNQERQDIIHNLIKSESNLSSDSHDTLDKPITINEVKRIVKKLKNGKSAGNDMVINEMLKFSLELLVPAIAKLFNIVLKSGIFPSKWNTTFQVPLYKKGDPLNCDNYRGISLTSCLGKVFTGLLAERLQNFLAESSKLSPFQAAFRKNHGTNDHIFTLKTLITKYVKRLKSKLFCCFIDFRKAFDGVWREAMFWKLRKLGIGGLFYNVVKNMYSETKSCVKLANGLTEMFTTSTGIKQGDSLSPILFNTFIDDVTGIFCPVQCAAVSLDDIQMNCLIYADDLLIISNNALGLQNALHRLNAYTNQWALEINIQKTKIIVFKTGSKDENVKFYIGENEIEIVNSFTYLGILITANGKFSAAMNNLKTKAMRAAFKISSILKSQNIIDPIVSLKLFDSMVKPILLYGSQVWAQELLPYESKDINKLDRLPFEQIQNKQCKYILGVRKHTSNVAARAELGRFPLYINVITLSIKFWIQILKSPDKLSYRAYKEECYLDLKGEKNWVTFVKSTLKRCNLLHYWEKQAVPDEIHLLKLLKKSLESQYKTSFNELLNKDTGSSGNGGNKLRTYAKIKNNYVMEPYMQYNFPPSIKRSIAQIRLSSHDLEIERGRRTRPKPTPACERYCHQCRTKVEDEIHFVIECPMYDDIRNELIFSNPNIPPSDKFIALFNSENKTLLYNLGLYISRALQYRKDSLTKVM